MPEQPDLSVYRISAFLDQGRYLRGWSPATIRSYRQALGLLETALTGAPLTKASLQDFVVWMRTRGLTAGGCNVRIRSINSFLTWRHDEGMAPERLRLKVLRAEQKMPRAVSPTDVRKLLAFRPTGTNASRAWVVVLVLLDTGVRIAEALGLERTSVDLEQLFLRVRGKGSKERLVPISSEGRKHLFRWLQTTQKAQPDSRFVFCTAKGVGTLNKLPPEMLRAALLAALAERQGEPGNE